jgi:hypothetical protein
MKDIKKSDFTHRWSEGVLVAVLVAVKIKAAEATI